MSEHPTYRRPSLLALLLGRRRTITDNDLSTTYIEWFGRTYITHINIVHKQRPATAAARQPFAGELYADNGKGW